MYYKSFQQQFESSIARDPMLRAVFNDMCALADRHGNVDMTYEAIAARTRWPIETIIAKIGELMQIDPQSRSPEFDGARLVPLDLNRAWGWRVVNYRKYRRRQYDDSDKRRSYKTQWQREKRAKERVDRVRTCGQVRTDEDRRGQSEDKCLSLIAINQELNLSTEDSRRHKAEADIAPEGVNDLSGTSTLTSELEYGGRSTKSNDHQHSKKKPKLKRNGLADSEWLAQLAHDPVYDGIDVRREFGKMANWCKLRKKLPTRQRFVNWLNRADVPLGNIVEQNEVADDEEKNGGWTEDRLQARQDVFPRIKSWPETFDEVPLDIQRQIDRRVLYLVPQKNGAVP